MTQLTSTEIFKPSKSLSMKSIDDILLQFNKLKGIKSIEVELNYVKIEYNVYILTSAIIKDTLQKGGFPFEMDLKHEGIFRKFINKLGRDNSQAFGGKPPTCCGNV